MDCIDTETSLWALFLSAFISSTLAPGGSEVLLAYLASKPEYSKVALLLVASLGNTLGALTTFGLGHLAAKKYSLQAHLSERHQKGIKKIERWGPWVLLFSWLPVVGDALCFAAGWMKIHFIPSLLAITVGKVIRYGIVISLSSSWLS